MQQDKGEIERLKESLSITLVAEALGLSVERRRFHCIYPMRHAHGDRTASVSLSEEKGLFRCWVCPDVRGDVFSLVQLVRDCSFPEAVEWLREQFRPWTRGNQGSQVAETAQGSVPKGVQKSVSKNVSKRLPPRPEAAPPKPAVKEADRMKVVLSFLKRLDPVDETPAARWLRSRRIFKPVWDKLRLRYITNYKSVSDMLLAEFGLELLQRVGLFNEGGHLRYYKHRLVFPYLDQNYRSMYFQARALDKETRPKELNLPGAVPYPYNVAALDSNPGWVYLCEGVVDTLTLLNQKIPAVGVPGATSFKAEWVPLFRNKSVVICLDPDEAGRRGAQVVRELLGASGVRCVERGNVELPESLKVREHEDINERFGGK